MWNPKWKTSIYGGWTSVSYDDNAKALIAASTCGNQAGAGNLLPAAFSTTAIANFPTQQSGSITNVKAEPKGRMMSELGQSRPFEAYFSSSAST